MLLLDEPTTALGPEDVDRLHALVHERSRAGVGIVYVSHRLPEVLGIADRISVLRDGVCQGRSRASMSEESLVALMIGRPLQLAFPERHEREEGARCSSRSRDSGRSVRADRPRGGERRDRRNRGRGGQRAGAVPPGARRCGAGHGNGDLRRQAARFESPLGPLRAGVVLLSGDRASESLFPVLSVRAERDDPGAAAARKLGFLSRRRERRTVDDLVRRLSIRTASIEQPVQTLSGGNQQKVSLTRPFLRGDVKVILAEEPTQGVDVAARFDIYDALREKAKRASPRSSSRATRSSSPASATGSS